MHIYGAQLSEKIFDCVFEASAIHTFRIFRESPLRLLENFPGAMLVWRHSGHSAHVVPRVLLLGNPEPKRMGFIGYHVFEKYGRLIGQPALTTAWLSRDEIPSDPLHHKYGGGFTVQAGTFVITGFDEALEDHFLVEALNNIGAITHREMWDIGRITNNRHIQYAHPSPGVD